MKIRKIMAFTLSILMLASANSCGSTNTSKKDQTATTTSAETGSGSDNSENEDTDTEATTGSSSADSAKKNSAVTTTTSASDKSAKTTTTAAGNKSTAVSSSSSSSNGSSSSDTSSSSSSSDSGSSAALNDGSSDPGSASASSADSSSGDSSSSGGNTSSGVSSSSSSSGGSSQSSSGGSSSASSSSSTTTDDDTGEVVTYDAKVTLGSTASASGNNVTVSGSIVYITAGGDYYISGSCSEGQIYIDTAAEEKVKLVLDGVSLSNSNAPAIYVYEAKKCVIEMMDGTVSALSDNASGTAFDGAIFSNDTVKLKGTGTLNITTSKAHGISSDDDIIIDDGNITINSGKSGIVAHDDITINGGNINITGKTNGIKSKGTININGGTSVVCGGTKEEKSSVYAASTFNYTGGYLFAAGNMVSPPTVYSNPYIVLQLASSASGGNNVKLTLNGTKYADFTPTNSFLSVMMLAPEISSGSTFSAEVGGSSVGTFTVADGQNLFTQN